MRHLVTTDAPFSMPTRRLTKQFGTSDKAIGTNAPNTLHTNVPVLADAMGVTPNDGMLVFVHDGATQDFTISLWLPRRKALDAAKGWILKGNSAALSLINVVAESLAIVKVPPNTPFFIHGTTAVNNCWVNGEAHSLNNNTDPTDA